jgi:phytoene dehydrogenase-like protein
LHDTYPLDEIPATTIFEGDRYRFTEPEYTPSNAPIMVIPGDLHNPKKTLVAFAPISYDFFYDSKKYAGLKMQAETVIHGRICRALGKEFESGICLRFSGTPQTIERYTNAHRGTYMGIDIDQKNYGKFLDNQSSYKNLFFVGQWTFPGFGASGVMAGGYYLAKKILKKENINLENKFKEFFE